MRQDGLRRVLRHLGERDRVERSLPLRRMRAGRNAGLVGLGLHRSAHGSAAARGVHVARVCRL